MSNMEDLKADVNAAKKGYERVRRTGLGTSYTEDILYKALTRLANVFDEDTESLAISYCEKNYTSPDGKPYCSACLTKAQLAKGVFLDEAELAEVERAAAEKAVANVRSEIRQIPRWWNPELGYGEFDLQPLGSSETSEKGAYMEVMRVLDECAAAVGLTADIRTAAQREAMLRRIESFDYDSDRVSDDLEQDIRALVAISRATVPDAATEARLVSMTGKRNRARLNGDRYRLERDAALAALGRVRAAVNGPHPANSGLDSFTLAHISAALDGAPEPEPEDDGNIYKQDQIREYKEGQQ